MEDGCKRIASPSSFPGNGRTSNAPIAPGGSANERSSSATGQIRYVFPGTVGSTSIGGFHPGWIFLLSNPRSQNIIYHIQSFTGVVSSRERDDLEAGALTALKSCSRWSMLRLIMSTLTSPGNMPWSSCLSWPRRWEVRCSIARRCVE